MPRAVILALALLALVVTAATAQSSSSTGTITPINPSSDQQPIITRVSGCLDTTGTNGEWITVECVRPMTLTLYGSGFLTGLESNKLAYIWLEISTPAIDDRRPKEGCVVTANSLYNDTYIECNYTNRRFGIYAPSTMLNLTLTNRHIRQTAVFAGVAFKNLPVPHIDSIHGCDSVTANGQITFNCHPERHSLTLSGTNFRYLWASLVAVNLGQSSFTAIFDSPLQTRTDLVYWNDTTVVLAMNGPQWIKPMGFYGAMPIPLALGDTDNDGLWRTNAVYFEYSTLPGPVVTGVRSTDCPNENDVFIGCTVGVSRLTIIGKYFYGGTTVTVGGQPVSWINVDSSSFDRIYTILPRYQYDSDSVYDITVRNLGGSVTVPDSGISFAGTPTIAQLRVCNDARATAGLPVVYDLKCLPGEYLTMTVYYFRTDIVPVIHMVKSNLPAIEFGPCHYVDTNTLACTVPPSPVNGTTRDYENANVRAAWPDGTASNNSPAGMLWDTAGSPRIASIEGCNRTAGMSQTEMDHCLGNEVVSICGSRFIGRSWNVLLSVLTNSRQFTVYGECDNVTVIDNSTLTCKLPIVDRAAQLEYGVDYAIYLHYINATVGASSELSSNVGYVRFVEFIPDGPIGPNGPTGSAGPTGPAVDGSTGRKATSVSPTTIALATVFTVFGIITLTLLAVVLIRRYHSIRGRPRSRTSSRSFANRSSHSYLRHVELSEYY